MFRCVCQSHIAFSNRQVIKEVLRVRERHNDNVITSLEES
jgi:hypothetical protein